jgi:hypothetical protein
MARLRRGGPAWRSAAWRSAAWRSAARWVAARIDVHPTIIRLFQAYVLVGAWIVIDP